MHCLALTVVFISLMQNILKNGLQKFSVLRFFIKKWVLKCNRDHLSTGCFGICTLWQIISSFAPLVVTIVWDRVHGQLKIARIYSFLKDFSTCKIKQERCQPNLNLKRDFFFSAVVYLGLEIVGYFLVKIKHLKRSIYILPFWVNFWFLMRLSPGSLQNLSDL